MLTLRARCGDNLVCVWNPQYSQCNTLSVYILQTIDTLK